MPSSNVLWEISDSVGTLTFTRPQAKNALTWDMYDALARACDQVDHDQLDALVIAGRGHAFAAGTDISQFQDVTSGDAGVAYERRLEAVLDRLERVRRPTLAVVDGPAVGGGCAIALACDFRLATSRARFGIPVSRTLGNCLSMANLARLVDAVGTTLTRDLLITGRLVGADEAARLGLATLVADEALDREVADWIVTMRGRARSTVEATKAMLLRLRAARRPAPADDLVAACYASEDFREGVAAFMEGRRPRWRR